MPNDSDRNSRHHPLLLDAKNLSRLLSTSTATVWRWEAAGKLPRPVRPTAGTTRWLRSDVVRWIELGCPGRQTFEHSGDAGF